MAIKTFISNAVAIKDSWLVTVGGTWVAADKVTIPINGKNLVVTIGTLITTAQVATTLQQAWAASALTDTTASVLPTGGGLSIPEHNELVATVSGSAVTLLGKVAGVPVTVSSPTTTSAAGTVTLTHPTLATGPWHDDNLSNWLEGSLPVSTDDIFINGPYVRLYGATMAAVVPASITFGDRCTGVTQFGLPFRNAFGYEEYRGAEWNIGATVINVLGPVGLVKINCGTLVVTANVYASGASLEANFAPIQIRGTHASNVVNSYGGNVSVASRNETATVATARQAGAGRLTLGKNVTKTNLFGTITLLAG